MFVTLRFEVIPQSKEDYEEISKLMRLYGSTVRYAYNRFLENHSKNEVYHLVRKTFKDLPSWYVNSAIEGLPGAYGRNSGNHKNLWQILEVALTTLLPEKRCLSPLKPILIQGTWEKVVGRLGPFCLGGPE